MPKIQLQRGLASKSENTIKLQLEDKVLYIANVFAIVVVTW